jgi:hypothetical protein
MNVSGARKTSPIAQPLGLIILGAALASLASPALAAAPSPFDKPVKVLRVPLPPDPDNLGTRLRVSCFYFTRFVVKEVDFGEVGAQQLSIIPAPGGPGKIACRQANIPGERVVAVKDWSGYFDGAKGDYVVFRADDGSNGGMGFAVYDARTGKKLFDDVVQTQIQAMTPTPSGLTLSYRRVYLAKCSLNAGGAGCWGQIKRATGLTAVTPPDCNAAYAREAKRTPKLAQSVRSTPTVIAYPVLVVILGGAGKITPVSGPAATCRLSD